jgi:SAM-dependent methyltransferase
LTGLALLDTCCAAGARQSLSRCSLGAHVTGCDITPTAIEIATQTARRIGKDIRFVVADAHTLDGIGDASQDLVYATYVIWLADLGRAAQAWYRVLRPGGRLLLRQRWVEVVEFFYRVGDRVDGVGTGGTRGSPLPRHAPCPERLREAVAHAAAGGVPLPE